MTVIYLHGFASGTASSKAVFFAGRLRAAGIETIVPDLAQGDFEHLTISGQLEVIERAAARRPVVLIGSSMGGYLAALYAARHPEVERLVLLAPAFGFARRWPESLGEEVMAEWRRTGKRRVFHYSEGRELELWYDLVTDGLRFEEYPVVRQPSLILHGRHDTVVPYALAEEFVRRDPLNRRLVLLESGHELTDVLERLWEEASAFLGCEDDAKFTI